jgi:hypothetical protein
MVLIKIPKQPVSSNKKDLTQETTPQGDDQAIQSNGTPDTDIPKPFIDKLTVNFTFQSAKQAYETHGVLYQNLTGDTEYFTSVGKPVKGFKLARQIVLPDCSSRPRIDYSFHADPDNGVTLADRVRLEFNPSKLGVAGLEHLHGILSSVISGGWQVFVKHGRISRLDVAVDLVGVRITKLKMVPKKAVVSQTWNSSKGKLLTYQWGKPTGSYTQIYNKTAEMEARGKAVSGPPITRFERRLKQPGCKTLTKLVELDNPFEGFVLTNAMPQASDGGKDWMWPLFCDSVTIRGLHAALQLVSEGKRPVYKKRFANAAPNWWNPEAIWAQWPAVVQQSKIGDPTAWA